MRSSRWSIATVVSVAKARRYLAVSLASLVGMLAWSGGAFAGDTLTLCVNPGGNVTSAETCKKNETSFKAVSDTALAALQAQVTALQGQVSTLQGQVAALTTQNTTQQTQIDSLNALLAGVTRTAGPTLLLTGMNLQVVNGTGGGTPNSLGNVIIGYNTSNGDTKTGSHNLVVGDNHTYTSVNGVVSGSNNKLTSTDSFVGGGHGNTASGESAFVSGNNNKATGEASFASGDENTASEYTSFVGGGNSSTASGATAFVGGGQGNTASGIYSFVGGGVGQVAGDFCANIFGTFFGPC